MYICVIYKQGHLNQDLRNLSAVFKNQAGGKQKSPPPEVINKPKKLKKIHNIFNHFLSFLIPFSVI